MEHGLALTATGFAVGLVVGLTGVGGGSLMTPALVALFRIPPAIAVGTDLAFAAITKAVGTGAHGRSGAVRWPVARLMMAGSLPSCLGALAWLRWSGAHAASAGGALRVAIAVSLVLTVAALLWRERLLAWRRSVAGPGSPRARAVATVAAAAVIGALVALSSIGAGAVGCVVIAMLHPDMQTREVAATDIAYAVPLTAVAATGHALAGNLDVQLLALLLAGSIPGIVLGARLSVRLADRISRRLLAGMLLLAAVKTVV